MTVARHLVELHGGMVTACSEGIDKGSDFRIVLRLTEENTAANQPSLFQEKAKTGLKIVVVDDNQDAAAMISELLAATGNEVFIAYDGYQAVAVAEQIRPDVIFFWISGCRE